MSILIENVSKQFGEKTVLDGINLEIKTGSLVALLGGSGSGKSTLLRIVAGFEAPNNGRVWLHGKDASTLAIQEKEIGFVFQAYALFQHLTVYENIAFGLSGTEPLLSLKSPLLALQSNCTAKSKAHKLIGVFNNGLPKFSKSSSLITPLEKQVSLSSTQPTITPPKEVVATKQNRDLLAIPYKQSKAAVLQNKQQGNKSTLACYCLQAQQVGSVGVLPGEAITAISCKQKQRQQKEQEKTEDTNTCYASGFASCKVKAKQAKAQQVQELLRLVQLEELANRYPSQLSGGQCQRVALARALAVQPKVLLLDEPFGALDMKVRKQLRRWLRHLHERVGVTTLFVTHDHQEAMEVANEIVVLDKGRVKHSLQSPQKMYQRLLMGNKNF